MPKLIRWLIRVGALVGLVYWRWRVKWSHQPCPPWLIGLLENPLMNSVAGSDKLLARAGVCAGMTVLDAGCGPGRLTLPIAERVGADGRVVGLDIQASMLRLLRQRLTTRGVTNVHLMEAGLGDGCLEPNTFDRAFLVTVLGEIPDRQRAVNELYDALKPGGLLSVTEVLPDPHFQTQGAVARLGEKAGFRVAQVYGSPFAFTMNLAKH